MLPSTDATTIALLVSGVLLLLSLFASKLGGRLGLPGLLLFLVIGMLAGSDGPGGIRFDNYELTQFVGTVALVFILFNGGLETSWRTTRPVLWSGISLATLGVVLTLGIVGAAAHYILGVPWVLALLLGTIVAPTDASAVFSVLKERALGLKGQIRPLLEFESGINDPTAVALVLGLTELATHPDLPLLSIAGGFAQELILGAGIGFAFGRLGVWLLNRVNLPLDGLYYVFTVALVAVIYGLTALFHGSGFLAVYVAAVVLGNSDFIHKRTLRLFHEGLSYLFEVVMFLLLGLLVFPTQLLSVALPALLVSLVLIVVARPAAVFLGLSTTRMPVAHKAMVAWVGLRGAVPIILATFPLLAKVEGAHTLFNVAFFVVLVSILIQGTSLPLVARLLDVKVPLDQHQTMPLEYTPTGAGKNDLVELILPAHSPVVGQRIVDLHLPAEALIVLLRRGDEYLIPRGNTKLYAGDVLQMLGSKAFLDEVRARTAAEDA
ncbi:potassium/proton antiporter (plasmid) [Deinococcus sp. KNUC1210]|uniref:potassium/proton antiporter n=1 Tax=Deinococcus sp. KNUC1210 TaxID=2917691 RepID=UPI001EF0E285|nr:potassium/proton antiporter [Deinococcus sp. KNUC1210]ULH17720.1 potassium/proton antiporter [Deinococcus sp. KNUC1210]